MSPAKKRKKKKTDVIDIIIKVLIVACAVTGVVLLGMLAVEFFSSDEGEINGQTENINVSTSEQDITEYIPEGSVTTEIHTTETETTEAETTVPTTTVPETTDAPVEENPSVPQENELLFIEEEDRITVEIDPDSEYWSLVVVNISRQMPSDYVPKLANVAGTSYQMDERVAPYYTQMYNAALKDGITLTPVSGYRSYERQKNNYANRIEICMDEYNLTREEARKKAATIVLPAGTSEHNLGLAMDICSLKTSFCNTKEYAWLVEHAHEYGFINRYAEDKQHITGIVYEPWHWRFVGVEYAEDIKNSGLSLEEWLTSKGIAY